MSRALGLLLLLALVLPACVSTEPLPAGHGYRFDVSIRGTAGERSVILDATADHASALGQDIALDDVTTSDDAIHAIRRIRIGGLRPQTGRRGAPTTGHIEFRELASRPIELVFEYKGHRDVYRLSMLTRGVHVEPASGEFTRVFTRS